MSKIKYLLFGLLSLSIFAHANTTKNAQEEKIPQIAIISTGILYDNQNKKDMPSITYAQGLLDKGIVPHKELFHFSLATTSTQLEQTVKQLYAQGVQYFIGAFIIDDIKVILKALPQTNHYAIISTAYTSAEIPANNIIRFNVSDKHIAPDYLAMYQQQFGDIKPIVIYGTGSWENSKAQIFKPIASKMIEFNNLKTLKTTLNTNIPDKTTPIILLGSNTISLLEAIPAISNPIIMGDLAIFRNLNTANNPNLKNISIYTLSTDVKNLGTYQVGKNILGHPIPSDISNLIFAMYYATDTIFSSQAKGSVAEKILVTHGPHGSGLMNDKGEFSTYATLLTHYDAKTQRWDVLRKIEHYDRDFKFSCIKENVSSN